MQTAFATAAHAAGDRSGGTAAHAMSTAVEERDRLRPASTRDSKVKHRFTTLLIEDQVASIPQSHSACQLLCRGRR